MIESGQPLSRYCELVGLRRLAILRGDEEHGGIDGKAA